MDLYRSGVFYKSYKYNKIIEEKKSLKKSDKKKGNDDQSFPFQILKTLKSSFHFIHDGFESFGMVHRQISQYFSVECDVVF